LGQPAEIRADTGEDFAAPRAKEKHRSSVPGSTEHERANGRMDRDPPEHFSVPTIAAGIAAVPKASGVSLTLFRRTIVRVDDDNGKTVFEFPF
jgi:hypothetical protein